MTLDNINKVEENNMDHKETNNDFCGPVELLYRGVQGILVDTLNIEFMPSLLSENQINHQVAVSKEPKSQTIHDPNLITDDES